MGALKRATLDELNADATLAYQVYARMIGDVPDPLRHEDGTLPTPVEICREMGLTYGGLVAWINADRTGERQREFDRVREIRAQVLAEEARDIADATQRDDVPKARLQVDVRRWLARAYAPRTYGADQGASASAHVTVVLSAEDMRG